MHHNLWAHNNGRNPYVTNNYHVDIINNVVYNWGDRAETFDFRVINGVKTWAETSGMKIGTDLLYSPQVNVDGNNFIAGPNTDTVDGVPNDPSELGTHDNPYDGCAPVQIIGISQANKTQAYCGRTSMMDGTNVPPGSGNNSSSTNLTALDWRNQHPGANIAYLWPSRYSSAEEKAARIPWQVPDANRYVITPTTADAAYYEVLGITNAPPYSGAGAPARSHG
jgi:hypothetical protein